MKKLLFTGLLLFLIGLTGCTATIYGVPQERWDAMGEQERVAVIEAYQARQAVLRQQREERARQQAIERERQRAIEAEEARQRQLRVDAVYRGEGVYGDLLRVTLQDGKLKMNGGHRTYQPVAFRIAAGETRQVEVVDLKGRKAVMLASYDGSTLLLDDSRDARRSRAARLVYENPWEEGKSYSNLSDKGPLELRGVTVTVQVLGEPPRDRHAGRRPQVIVIQQPAPQPENPKVVIIGERDHRPQRPETVVVQPPPRRDRPEVVVQEPPRHEQPQVVVEQPSRLDRPAVAVEQPSRHDNPEAVVKEPPQSGKPAVVVPEPSRRVRPQVVVEQPSRHDRPAVAAEQPSRHDKPEAVVKEPPQSGKPVVVVPEPPRREQPEVAIRKQPADAPPARVKVTFHKGMIKVKGKPSPIALQSVELRAGETRTLVLQGPLGKVPVRVSYQQGDIVIDDRPGKGKAETRLGFGPKWRDGSPYRIEATGNRLVEGLDVSVLAL